MRTNTNTSTQFLTALDVRQAVALSGKRSIGYLATFGVLVPAFFVAFGTAWTLTWWWLASNVDFMPATVVFSVLTVLAALRTALCVRDLLRSVYTVLTNIKVATPVS